MEHEWVGEWVGWVDEAHNQLETNCTSSREHVNKPHKIKIQNRLTAHLKSSTTKRKLPIEIFLFMSILYSYN